jgi:ferric-dicitrate binding protein FerR (iron transport regulator)
LAFEGQTLETVVAAFNRHNGRQLSIGDIATGQLRVGGKFRITDVDGFLAALARTNGVKAVSVPSTGKQPEVIVLTGGSAAGSAAPEAPSESTEE